jgi:hypothetical protein
MAAIRHHLCPNNFNNRYYCWWLHEHPGPAKDTHQGLLPLSQNNKPSTRRKFSESANAGRAGDGDGQGKRAVCED